MTTAHLRSATFLKNYRCFKEGARLDFRAGINLLVGDQGCGKSSLLQMLAALGGLGSERHLRDEMQKTATVEVSPVRAGYFDFEKHNPRIQAALGMGHGYDDMTQLSSMFCSHGEFSRSYVAGAVRVQGPALLFWDEPEGGLSLRSVLALASGLLSSAERGVQWVVATHHPVLIEAVGEVLSLEHGRWMPAAEFMESQKVPRTETPAGSPQKNRGRARKESP